jgi:DNA-binding NarL/FixJ family response regulator
MSIVALPEQHLYSTIAMVGHLGDSPYWAREIKILELLHAELLLLWRTPALRPPTQWRQALSPRLAQVLQGLERGQSEKQIASFLGLSRPTVHNHITRLHRLLEVNSLGELLAKSRTPPSFRPRLLPSGER